jgi:lipid-binding SYLF domain-containing protein
MQSVEEPPVRHRPGLARLFVLAGLLAAGCGAPAPERAARRQQMVVDRAATTLEEIRHSGGAQAADLVAQVQAVLLFPDLVSGGFAFDALRGEGVLFVRTPSGWRGPAFYSSTSMSLAVQLGVGNSGAALLVMSPKVLAMLLQWPSFRPRSVQGAALADLATATPDQLAHADIVSWTQSGRASGESAIAGSEITPRDEDDAAYYGTPATAQDVVDGKVRSQGAAALIAALGG